MIKKEFGFFVLLIFILPLFAQQIPLDARLRGGRIHFQGGRYDKALQQFEEALNDYPGNPEARFWKAIVLEKCGKFVEAAANFDTTYNDAPEWLEKTQKDEMFKYSAWNAFIRGGQIMDNESNYSAAIVFFKHAAMINPKNPQSFLFLSQVYTTLDSLEEIKKVAYTLHELDSTNHQINILLGVYFFKKEDWDSSMVYYDMAAIGFAEDREAVIKNIGKELKLDTIQASIIAQKLIEKRNSRKLESYITDSLKAKSKYLNLARLTDQLNIDEAELNITNFRSGVSALQKVNSLAQESLQQKYLKKAIDYFSEALRYNLLDYDARYNLGMTFYRSGYDVKAESIFKELVSTTMIPLNMLSDSLAQNLLQLITIDNMKLSYFEITAPVASAVEKELDMTATYKTGYWYLYFTALKKAKELPTKADYGKIFLAGLKTEVIENLWLLLGATQTNLKKYDDAIKAFNMVIDMNYKNEDAYRNLAVCYREKGDQQKAYSILQEWEKIKKQQ